MEARHVQSLQIMLAFDGKPSVCGISMPLHDLPSRGTPLFHRLASYLIHIPPLECRAGNLLSRLFLNLTREGGCGRVISSMAAMEGAAGIPVLSMAKNTLHVFKDDSECVCMGHACVSKNEVTDENAKWFAID